MKIKTYLCTGIISLYIVFIALAHNGYAVTISTFPSCLNPQGEVKVVNEGTHGIPGDPNAYTGHDVVYYLTEDTVLQCLCPENGKGIQTNWWRVPHLAQQEIDSLVQQGWIYIPNGTAWGLEDDPYLAQNIPFSCIGGKGGGGNGGSSSGGGGSPSSSSSGGQGGGEITSQAVSHVLGLASTGNSSTLYILFITGFSLLLSGIYIRHIQRS